MSKIKVDLYQMAKIVDNVNLLWLEETVGKGQWHKLDTEDKLDYIHMA